MNTPQKENNANPETQTTSKQRHALFDNVGTASMLGLHIVSGIIVGGVMGYALDSWFATQPWCFIVFLLLGIVAGFRNMWQDAQRIIRNTEESSIKPTDTTTETAIETKKASSKKTPPDTL